MITTTAADQICKLIFTITLSVFCTQGFFYAQASASVKIAILDDGAQHEKEIVSEYRRLLKKCQSCQIKTFPIYEKNGELMPSRFLSSVRKAQDFADIVSLSWNIESREQTKDIEIALNDLASKKILVLAAGAPKGDPPTRPLSLTVNGKIREGFIIGEMNEKGNLILNSYYGDELFTALTPPAKKIGSSFSVVRFVAALAIQMSLKNWDKSLIKSDLRNKKKASFKQYPSLEDLGL